jgi:hypothetical protein
MRRALRTTRSFLLLLATVSSLLPAAAFPVFLAADGSTVVKAAFGSNLVLDPDEGGALGGPGGARTRDEP